jgi:hypothetical protein
MFLIYSEHLPGVTVGKLYVFLFLREGAFLVVLCMCIKLQITHDVNLIRFLPAFNYVANLIHCQDGAGCCHLMRRIYECTGLEQRMGRPNQVGKVPVAQLSVA